MLYTSTNHAPWLKPLNRVTSLFGSLIFYTIVLDCLAEFDDDDVFDDVFFRPREQGEDYHGLHFRIRSARQRYDDKGEAKVLAG